MGCWGAWVAVGANVVTIVQSADFTVKTVQHIYWHHISDVTVLGTLKMEDLFSLCCFVLIQSTATACLAVKNCATLGLYLVFQSYGYSKIYSTSLRIVISTGLIFFFLLHNSPSTNFSEFFFQ